MVRGSLLPALLLLNVVTTRPPRELPVAVTFTVVLLLPLVWRHRAPRTVFGVLAGVAAVQWLLDVQLPADIALPVAFYAVAVHARLRDTLVAGAVLVAGGVLACLRWATDGAFLTPFVASPR
ncbi:DUF7134 domain-containing protein [Amycolatopsis iheyensis]|uniref:DUF7134 domain-containing protein n=1 Tax=Amycolatopsis iheyensis TaxID=2945988 RepID=UPI003FD7D51A